MITREEFMAKAWAINQEFYRHGFDKEWTMIFGFMLGRLVNRATADVADMLISDLISILDAGKEHVKIEFGGVP